MDEAVKNVVTSSLSVSIIDTLGKEIDPYTTPFLVDDKERQLWLKYYDHEETHFYAPFSAHNLKVLESARSNYHLVYLDLIRIEEMVHELEFPEGEQLELDLGI